MLTGEDEEETILMSERVHGLIGDVWILRVNSSL